ncbi:MAG TPA: HlyD family efflux transporter periplasmic adaptor subunit [Burkholderiales bacterium]|nr:HlyD family efflux transporter periplasmic adaptor subunit [Burkholderiales bacterium]
MTTGCGNGESSVRQGYVEADFVYVSSPHSGKLEKLAVRRGAAVNAGDLLFALDDTPERAAREETERRRAQALANFKDLKRGRRPSEIESVRAQVKQAQAALDLAHRELARQEKLIKVAGATTPQELDRARAVRDQERERVTQLEAELRTARLGSRSDQVAGAEANLRALDAALAKAEWDLAQKRQSAPVSGTVFDTLYREGEWVAAGRPVVALLPPQHVKVRTFVPEPWLGAIHVGDAVEIRVNGAHQTFAARVSFISPRAEYTPPVIYSRESREKLVFMVEAVFEPAVAAKLHPGQPVDVSFRLSAPSQSSAPAPQRSAPAKGEDGAR